MAPSRSHSGGTRVFIAVESFLFADENGNTAIVKKGQRVREGHPLLKGRESSFKLDDSIWEVPGKKE